ncbi:hypothetical protein KJ596_00945 [Patescibacteria group bacterium]|nr:hypothetical protein [Patescibacteria group bacterium]MBU1868807.1 hypothetical protein [Patescibacteria group bacterium]
MQNVHLFSPVPIYHGLGPVATRFVARIVLEEAGLIQGELSWLPGNPPTDFQMQLANFWPYMAEAYADVAESEMDAVISWDVGEVNRVLRDEWGCNIQLDAVPAPDRWVLYLAALVQFVRRWRDIGVEGYGLPHPLNTKAFALTAETHGVKFSSYDGNPVVLIPSQEGGWVLLTRARAPLSRFALYSRIIDIWAGQERGDAYPGVVLPYWKFEHQEVDVADLCGLATIDAASFLWWLVQAKMECECAFGIDGTSFKAAFAAAAMRGMSQPKDPGDYHVMDYDLYYGIVSPRGYVVASAYVPTDAFSATKVALDRAASR